MIADVEPSVERLDLGKALAQRFRLAVADDDDLAAGKRVHLRRPDAASRRPGNRLDDRRAGSGLPPRPRSRHCRGDAAGCRTARRRRLRPPDRSAPRNRAPPSRAASSFGRDIAPRDRQPVGLGPARQQHRPAPAQPPALPENFDTKNRPVRYSRCVRRAPQCKAGRSRPAAADKAIRRRGRTHWARGAIP